MNTVIPYVIGLPRTVQHLLEFFLLSFPRAHYTSISPNCANSTLLNDTTPLLFVFVNSFSVTRILMQQ